MVVIISRRKTHEEFIEELKDKNPTIEVLGRYINAITKIECKCKKCNKILNITPNNLLSGKGCYDCKMDAHIQRITKKHEDFVKELEHSDVKILGKYVNSKTNILTECKKCGYIWDANPNSLLIGTQCPKCAGVMRKTNEEFIKQLRNINSDITPLDDYIDSKSKISCKCNKCNYEWLVTPDALINSKTGCPNCNGGIKNTHEDFVERMKNVNHNIKILGRYNNSSTKILCKCKICSYEWNSLPTSLLNNHGCPNCDTNRKRKTHDEFMHEISNINPNINILDLYTGINNKILCECNICGNKWKPTPDSLLRGHGCPICNKSCGENNINNYLVSKNINFIQQQTFDKLIGVGGRKLSYDFYLPKFNVLIEYNGIQHYEPVEYFGGERQFKIQQEHDKRKRKYAEDNKIKLIEISYLDIDNIEIILESQLFKKSA